MGSYINKDNFWSESLTKHVLTVYAEGLTCNSFDKREFYNVMHYAKDMYSFL